MALVTKEVVFKNGVVVGKAKVYAIIIVGDDVGCDGIATGTTKEYTTIVWADIVFGDGVIFGIIEAYAIPIVRGDVVASDIVTGTTDVHATIVI